MGNQTAVSSHACPAGLATMRRFYLGIMGFRDFLLRPLTWALSVLRVTPNTLSYIGVGAMVFFAYIAREDIRRALWLLIFAFLLDLSDGALARRLHKDGDRGKFTDMVCDSVVFTLFLVGLVHAGLLGAVAGVCLAYFMLLSKVLRAVRNARFLETDWYFKAVAGFIPSCIVGSFYLLFVLYVATGWNVFTIVAALSIAFLVLDGAYVYRRVLTLTVPANPNGNASSGIR